MSQGIDHKDPAAHPVSPAIAASEVAVAAERWRRERYLPALGQAPERRSFRTDIGIDVKPLYTPADLESIGFDYLRDLGFPGEYPFTRGDRTTMYRTEPFVVSAYSGFGEGVECNKRFRKLVGMGVEQILVALDLPTQCGYDSDHEMATAEVGLVGVAINSLADVEAMFDGIPIDQLKRVGTLGNSIGPIVLAMFAALGEKRGIPWDRYVVNLQNDPLKEYIARGTQIFPAEPAVRIAVDAVTWCAQHAPHWSPMTVCVNHINAGGAGSSMATAIALGNALHYIDHALAQGRSIDDIAPLIHMFPDERHDFFVSVANLRALRRVWARLMRERYGAKKQEALALRMTVYGHGQEALQEPLNNAVRIGYGTLAYVLGGASYVYIASYDEAVSTPSEDAVRVALRTQQILAHEHGITSTIDPLGGAYFLESLTHAIEQEILSGLEQVEAAGGALRVIDGGLGRRVMNEGAVRRQRAIDSGERPWVTVNLWPQKPNVPNTAFRIDPATSRRQLERLAAVKASRDASRVEKALAAVGEACHSGANLVPSTLEAVRAYATLGEICNVWRTHFGSFSPSTVF